MKPLIKLDHLILAAPLLTIVLACLASACDSASARTTEATPPGDVFAEAKRALSAKPAEELPPTF